MIELPEIRALSKQIDDVLKGKKIVELPEKRTSAETSISAQTASL